MISIVEFVNGVQQIGSGAPIVVRYYILGLIWKSDSLYLFDLHRKDENGNKSSFDTAIVRKFVTLHSMKNYRRSVYYSAYSLTWSQMQVYKSSLHCQCEEWH